MAEPLQITNIRFRFGNTINSPNLEVNPESIIILVGPNNSGKSLALKEIESWCIGGVTSTNKIIENLTIKYPEGLDEASILLKKIETNPNLDEQHHPEVIHLRRPVVGTNTNPHIVKSTLDNKTLKELLANPDDINLNRRFREIVVSNFVIRLDGRTRFLLTEAKPSGNLASTPQNHLWQLFVDDAARQTAREFTSQAFGLNLVIDPTAMTEFRIKMSLRPPLDIAEEKSLDERARSFYQQAIDIQRTSDGVQAFTGLVTAMLSLPFKILLVDEPEAFLHPPLSRRLGNNMARLAREQKASLFISTHSSEFVMGCIETVSETQIVRLTYENGVATAKNLTGIQIQSMIKNPLMRSTGTLQALFHKCAIVTESDTDRSFYEEINTRLRRIDRGIEDALFLNAQNKQTIFKVVEPLRNIGIPAIGIYDLDIIRIGDDFTNILNSAKISQNTIHHLRTEKNWLLQKLQSIQVVNGLERDPLKFGGINHLDLLDKSRSLDFMGILESYGIFIVPFGEIEQWLSELGIVGKGNSWLIPMFNTLGDEGSDTYVKPSDGDVWEFLDKINDWVINPQRQGM